VITSVGGALRLVLGHQIVDRLGGSRLCSKREKVAVAFRKLASDTQHSNLSNLSNLIAVAIASMQSWNDEEIKNLALLVLRVV